MSVPYDMGWNDCIGSVLIRKPKLQTKQALIYLEATKKSIPSTPMTSAWDADQKHEYLCGVHECASVFLSGVRIKLRLKTEARLDLARRLVSQGARWPLLIRYLVFTQTEQRKLRALGVLD